MPKDFRFGVGLRVAKSLSSVQDAARRAEDLGFDVLHLPDHIGAPAPFPTLMAAAAATTTLRMGTFVLNACFYKPALLARDVQALRDLSDGRFELGLGAGYAREEFEAAELPYPSARQRIEYLAHVTEYMGEHLPDLPILIAGNGDRLLTVAAQQATIIGLTGGQPITDARDPLAERTEFVRRAAGDRFDDLELNIAITALPRDESGQPDLSDHPPGPPVHVRRRVVADARRVVRVNARDSQHHSRVPGHLRRELPDRPGQARRGVFEGDRRTALVPAAQRVLHPFARGPKLRPKLIAHTLLP